ncbi:MAG: FecR domain-containing protein [Pseudomonadota bacterium]
MQLMDHPDSDIRAEAHLWRARFDDGLSGDEKQLFDDWLHADHRHAEAYAEAEIFWSAAGRSSYCDALMEALEQQPESVAQVQAEKQTSAEIHWLSSAGKHIVATAMAIAACIAAVFIIGIPMDFFSEPAVRTQEYATERGNRKIIILPDKTRVTLGAASKLELAFSDTQRSARLVEGNAFFEVASDADRPFIVATPHATVAVTGTKFDMQLREATLAVAVGEGSVRVSRATADNADKTDPDFLDLTAGQAVRASSQSGFGAVTEVFPTELGAWRTGRLVYILTPLTEIMSEVNRYTERPIRLDPRVADLQLSGTFNTNDIEGLLQSIDEGLPVAVVTDDAGQRIIVPD